MNCSSKGDLSCLSFKLLKEQKVRRMRFAAVYDWLASLISNIQHQVIYVCE